MLLEKIGKFCFGKIRASLFFFLSLVPLLFALLYLYFQSNELREIQEGFQFSLERGKASLERKALKERFLTRYSHCDPYFLDQQVESLTFLQKEQKELKNSISHPAISRRDFLEERLSFLLSDENKISFAEQNIRTSFQVKETEEKQRHPIQVDEEDLKMLLSIIEDVPIGDYVPPSNSPQLLIQNFQLHKQNTSIDTEVFLLEMTLIKREFTL